MKIKVKVKELSLNLVLLTLFILVLRISSKSESKEHISSRKFIKDLHLHNDYEAASLDSLNLNDSRGDNLESMADNITDNDYQIVSMEQVFTLDAVKASCDLNVKERVSFQMESGSNVLEYIIISKKTPLYGFNVKSLNDKNSVKAVKVYQDSSFRQRAFIDEEGRRLSFRDRWLLEIELLKRAKEAELEIEYNMQRAVLIDSTSETNFLKFALINPHPETIKKYSLVINLLNFENLKAEELKVPLDSIINYSRGSKNIQITTKKAFEKHTEYEVNLNLPYEFSSCEGNIVNYVYYGLISMSVLFVIMSIGTLTFLYKE